MKFGATSRRRLAGVHPDLVAILEEAIGSSPVDFGIASGVRTVAEQLALYAQGRTLKYDKRGNRVKIVTNCDGIAKKSNHQARVGYGYAVDVFGWVDGPAGHGKADWTVNVLTKIARHVQQVAKKHGRTVTWGGTWKRFKDFPHLEMKTK